MSTQLWNHFLQFINLVPQISLGLDCAAGLPLFPDPGNHVQRLEFTDDPSAEGTPEIQVWFPTWRCIAHLSGVSLNCFSWYSTQLLWKMWPQEVETTGGTRRLEDREDQQKPHRSWDSSLSRDSVGESVIRCRKDWQEHEGILLSWDVIISETMKISRSSRRGVWN